MRARTDLVAWSTTTVVPWRMQMSWTKPEFEVVELGMEVGAYAGNA
jgi:coenzyme PQQ precursor peptide PqqA